VHSPRRGPGCISEPACSSSPLAWPSSVSQDSAGSWSNHRPRGRVSPQPAHDRRQHSHLPCLVRDRPSPAASTFSMEAWPGVGITVAGGRAIISVLRHRHQPAVCDSRLRRIAWPRPCGVSRLVPRRHRHRRYRDLLDTLTWPRTRGSPLAAQQASSRRSPATATRRGPAQPRSPTTTSDRDHRFDDVYAQRVAAITAGSPRPLSSGPTCGRCVRPSSSAIPNRAAPSRRPPHRPRPPSPGTLGYACGMGMYHLSPSRHPFLRNTK